MAISETTYKQTVVTAPTTPSTTSVFDLNLMAPLIRELVVDGVIDEPKLSQDLDSSRSFFTGQNVIKTDFLLSNLKFGQQVRVNIEKDQNPLSLYQKSQLDYQEVDTCHDQIKLDCTVPCLNTLPTFQYIIFRFDCEYAYGVRACDKNKDFWDYDYFTKQYALSRRAEQFGRELDLWNTVIKGLIAAPATTVDAKVAKVHPTHYWNNLGTVGCAGREAIQTAYWYMVTNFQDVMPTVFMTDEAARELIKSVENPYNLNRAQNVVNTFEEWNVPGFIASTAVKELLPAVGSVVIMKRSPWLTVANAGTMTSQFPLWNADGTKQYVALLDPRVGFQFAKDGYHLVINPYDCDHLIRGMVDTEYVGSGITFPQWGLILEFCASDFSINCEPCAA